MLADAYKMFLEKAYRVPGFISGTKNEIDDVEDLAMGYIIAERHQDELLQEGYLSALMIRHWYMIPYVYEQSKSLRVEIDDIVIWLYQAFVKAFKYKSWIDPDKQASKEKNGAEKCFNRCIDSIRQGYFQQSNTDSRKINYMTYSVEESIEKWGDAADGLLVEEDNSVYNITSLVVSKLQQNRLMSALILDNICYNNCFSKDKFSIRKLVSNMDIEYIKSFTSRYNVSKTTQDKINALLKTNKATLNKKVIQELSLLKNDSEVKSLCYPM